MKAQDLKNSVLQLAIQGKLVEQRAEEGTAKELIEQIKAEKERLIKEKKIKKEKPLPEITEDEIPFEIPESWEWVRLGGIGFLQTGNTPSKTHLEYFGNFIPFISPGDILNGVINYDNQGLTEEGLKYGRVVAEYSIMQVCIGGSIGKSAINEKKVTFNQQINSITPYLVNVRYLYYCMTNDYFYKNIRSKATGTATPIINKTAWSELLIALPPLEEQKRIVSKIEELLPYVEQYDKAYSKLEIFNKKFPEDMQKSILQYAIQGKLVEQRPEEGTAEELYQQIQVEKERLIKEGEIKKGKPLSEITEDEIPFEIPESWKWVRLQGIITILGDGIHGTPHYDDSGDFHFINGNNLDNGKIIIKENTKRVNKQEYEKYKKYLNKNSVLVSINGTIGNVAFYKDEKVMLGKSACYFNLVEEKLKYYIYWIIKTNYFMKYAIYNATGTTIKNVSLETMKNLLIPLPPLSEQKRIVQAIEEYLPYYQQLIK